MFCVTGASEFRNKFVLAGQFSYPFTVKGAVGQSFAPALVRREA
jgi:hypothetical protein